MQIGGPPTPPFDALLEECEANGVTVQDLHEMLESVRRVRIALESDSERCRLELAIMQVVVRRRELAHLLENTLVALLWEAYRQLEALPEPTSCGMQYRELDSRPYEEVLWGGNVRLLELMGVRHRAI